MTFELPRVETPAGTPVLDNFNREEKPLSDGGKWTVLPNAGNTGETRISPAHWEAKSIEVESAAYWNVSTFRQPACCIEFIALPRHLLGQETFFGLWCCLVGTATTGYRATIIPEQNHDESISEGLFKLDIEKWEAAFPTVLATRNQVTFAKTDLMGFKVSGGILTVWRRHAGEWSELLSVRDNTFSSGYVGMGTIVTGASDFGHYGPFQGGPSAGPFTQRLVQRMQPWLTTDFERYLVSIAQMYEPWLELAEERHSDGEPFFVPAWGSLFNPETCPFEALGYLAQYVGVKIPSGASEAEARELVKIHAGFERGTTKSIEEAIYAGTTLTRTGQTLVERSVLIERRGPEGTKEAYRFGISVPSADIPSESALIAKVMAVTPAGIWPWLNTGEKYTFAEAIHAFEEDVFSFSETRFKQP